MDLGIAGKKALVMSSSRGIGLGISEALAAEGCDVLLTARDGDRLATAAEAINARDGGRAISVVADLADPASVDVLADAVQGALGAADIFVANTGGPPPGIMAEVDPAALGKHFDIMVVRVVSLAQRLVPQMRAAGWGRIVAVGSSGVIQPIPNLAISNVVRSSLASWTKSLSNDLAGDEITVNMLVPGRIHTDRVDQIDTATAKRMDITLEDVRAASRATIPSGRYGTVEEFAGTAAFLCSQQAGYITGSIVRCDGGLIRSL